MLRQVLQIASEMAEQKDKGSEQDAACGGEGAKEEGNAVAKGRNKIKGQRPEYKAIAELITQDESTVFSRLVKSTLRSLSTVEQFQLFTKITRERAAQILSYVRDKSLIDRCVTNPMAWRCMTVTMKRDRGGGSFQQYLLTPQHHTVNFVKTNTFPKLKPAQSSHSVVQRFRHIPFAPWALNLGAMNRGNALVVAVHF